MHHLNRRGVLQGLAAAALPWPALAQDGRPVRLLVGFPAGGSFDAIARILADKFRVEMDRPVVVENKPGAGGRIVVDTLKAAPPDGSVLLLGMDALVSIYPHTMRKLNYDPKKDLVPIGTIAEFPFALSVSSDLKVSSLREFVAWVKRNPAKFNVGIPALGGPHHFYTLMLGELAGVRAEPVVFQGSTPIYQALFGGHVTAAFDGMTSMVEHHKAGKLRILAVVADRRMPQAPDVPTFVESGYPAIRNMGFTALYAPPLAPAAIVSRWNAALAKVLAAPEVRERILAMGFIPVGKSVDELVARSNASYTAWEPVIRASRYQAD